MNRSKFHAGQKKVDSRAVERAKDYLFGRLRKYPLCRSYVGYNMEITAARDFSKEIFSTVLVLTMVSDLPDDIQGRMLDQFESRCDEKSHWCFFLPDGRWSDFPEDLDTTALVLSQLLKRGLVTHDIAMAVADDMIDNRNADGIIQVYFDPDRPRTDPIVSTNVLYFMHQVGLADRDELRPSREYVRDFLMSGEYLNGTRYYPSPDTFLFFLARLVVGFDDAFGDLVGELRAQLLKRVGSSEHSLDLAMRVVALQWLGITNRIECQLLHQQQLADGGWTMNGFFLAPSKDLYFGGRELTSALALEAITSVGI